MALGTSTRRSSRRIVAAIGAALMLAALVATQVSAGGAAPTTQRVSVDSHGAQGNGESREAWISANGRFVAFESGASNLVAGDTNGMYDVFVHDRATGETRRASVSSEGGQANDSSGRPTISATGRFVVFVSGASNLVAGDTNGLYDVFVHDMTTGRTRRVNVDSQGREEKHRSVPGRGVASPDGRFVVFSSDSSELVEGDTNDVQDAFVRDRRFGTTRRVSVSSRGVQGDDESGANAVTNRGRIFFTSAASNLVAHDTNNNYDVFTHDLSTGRTRRISVGPRGKQGNDGSTDPSVSADGRFVSFTSHARLVRGDKNRQRDVYVRDLRKATTRRVSIPSQGFQIYNGSDSSAVSADGRFVAFESDYNFAARRPFYNVNVWLRDMKTGRTRKVSAGSLGEQEAPHYSFDPSISADGRFVSFVSFSSDLVEGDTNRTYDVFVRGPLR